MRVERWGAAICLLAGAASHARGRAHGTGAGTVAGCAQAVIEGEVEAGKGFERRIGMGLEVWLQPIASGWIVRVVPAAGPRGKHDYAELATPPYGSVSPLSVSTDFSFRAQDAVAWNPRRFQYLADAAEFQRVSTLYEAVMQTKTPAGAVQAQLAAITSRASEGTLQILDAKLVPGTADQAGTAATVASHFAQTAHTLEQPADSQGSTLGRIMWMRFRIRLDVPAGSRGESGVTIEPRACSVVR